MLNELKEIFDGIDGTILIAILMVVGSLSYVVRNQVAGLKNLLTGSVTRNFRMTYKDQYFVDFLRWFTGQLDHSILPTRNYKAGHCPWHYDNEEPFEKVFGFNKLWMKIPGLPFFRINYESEGSNDKNNNYDLEPSFIELSTFGFNSSKIDAILRRFLDYLEFEKKNRIEDKSNGEREFEIMKVRDRSLDNIVLCDGVRESIIGSIEAFFNSTVRKTYMRLGVPYRRGILLFGPPGCGKTSLILGIRSHFRLPIYTINLNSVRTDEHLKDLMMAVPPKTLLVMEDIDCIGAPVDSRNGESSFRPTPQHQENSSTPPIRHTVTGIASMIRSELTLSGLLNAIDGLGSLEDVVIIMTTNHPEKLDPALLRSGRIDLKVSLDKFEIKQQVELYNLIFNKDMDYRLTEPKLGKRLAACDVQEACLSALLEDEVEGWVIAYDKLFKEISL